MFTLTQLMVVAVVAFVLGLIVPLLFVLSVILNANIREE